MPFFYDQLSVHQSTSALYGAVELVLKLNFLLTWILSFSGHMHCLIARSDLSSPMITSVVTICITCIYSNLLPSIQIGFDPFQFFLNQANGIGA